MPEKTALEIATPSDKEIRMTRSFRAPREMVFESYTKPELLKRWLNGPPEWALTECEIDLKVGGEFHYVWTGPEAAAIRMRGVYLEIQPPARLVYNETYEEDWTDGETTVTLEFTEQGDETVVTTTILFSSKEGRDGALKTGMQDGMGESYRQLDDFLAENPPQG